VVLRVYRLKENLSQPINKLGCEEDELSRGHVNLRESHWHLIEQYGEEHGSSSRSEALRELLNEVTGQ